MTDLTLLLPALEERWARHHLVILQHLRPGIDKSQVEAALAPLGLRPSAEMVEWWGWHDGIVELPTKHMRITGSRLEFLPVTTAVAEYEMQRQASLEAWDDGEPGEMWPRGYFPWVTGGGGDSLALDLTAQSEGTPVRCRYKDHWDNEQIDASSMAGVVAAWLKFFDVGAWGYDERIGGIGIIDNEKDAELRRRFPGMT